MSAPSAATMTTTKATRETRRVPRPGAQAAAAVPHGTGEDHLILRLPVDQLSRVASLVGLGTAVLAAAGILSSTAYLSAWEIPSPLMRLDPLTAAVRADTVTLEIAILAGTIYLLSRASRWGWRRGRLGRAVVCAIVGSVAALGAWSAITGQWGGALTDLGALAIVAAHAKWRISDRAVLASFALVALTAAYATGVQFGTIYRDFPAYRTAIQLTSRMPIAGLEGEPLAGGAFRYDNLYLVFRDGEAVYLSRSGVGRQVWIVPASTVVALGVNVGSAR